MLHLKYWAQYGINQAILERFNVKQVGYLAYTSNSDRAISFKYREKNQIVSAYDINGRIKVYTRLNSSYRILALTKE